MPTAICFWTESTTSRLKSVTDALEQTKQFTYADDNRLIDTSYSDAVNPTPNVTFSYDPYFPRQVSMTDGDGTTQYSHVPVGSFGAPQMQQKRARWRTTPSPMLTMRSDV
jgi:hypothetical protein